MPAIIANLIEQTFKTLLRQFTVYSACVHSFLHKEHMNILTAKNAP